MIGLAHTGTETRVRPSVVTTRTAATSPGATSAAPSRVVPCFAPVGETSQLPAGTGAPERGTTSMTHGVPAGTPSTLRCTRTQPGAGITRPVSFTPVAASVPVSVRVPAGVLAAVDGVEPAC